MHRMTKGAVVAGAAIILGFGSCADAQSQSAHDVPSIYAHMEKLRPLVGNWTVVAEFHDRDGGVSYDDGVYAITPALDGSYLQIAATLWTRGRPEQRHGFLAFVTYNPVTQSYDSTYFYTRWAMRVMETGVFDDASHQFRTNAFIPKEDGIRDENVRTITDLSDPQHVKYMHFSRYADETTERNDVTFTLTPAAVSFSKVSGDGVGSKR